MAGNAFVYGTLMAPEVLKLLINRVPPMKPATLSGYRRYCVKGQVYPAIVPDSAQEKVKGQVIIGLTQKEFHILDVYEADEYYKQSLTVELEDNSTLPADVYIWQEKYRPLLHGNWEYDAWRDEYLTLWLTRLSGNKGVHPDGDLQA